MKSYPCWKGLDLPGPKIVWDDTDFTNNANDNSYSISVTTYRINKGKHLDPQDRKSKYTCLATLHDQLLVGLDKD